MLDGRLRRWRHLDLGRRNIWRRRHCHNRRWGWRRRRWRRRRWGRQHNCFDRRMCNRNTCRGAHTVHQPQYAQKMQRDNHQQGNNTDNSPYPERISHRARLLLVVIHICTSSFVTLHPNRCSCLTLDTQGVTGAYLRCHDNNRLLFCHTGNLFRLSIGQLDRLSVKNVLLISHFLS